MTPQERFWSMVSKDCWIWQGAKERHGYGHFRDDGKDHRAHRYAYELANGPIPAGMHVLHKCDVMACVNPTHLRLGTHQENMLDCKHKKRTTIGERSGTAKLTREQAETILREYRIEGAKGTGGRRSNAKELAARFGVGPATVVATVSGRSWPNLERSPQ